ncbi:MAG: DUF4886 domain-containing protein [Planctomycetota bacterium]
MRRHAVTVLVLFAAVCCHGAQAATDEPSKVLMIGNSLTYTYKVPTVIVALATSAGKKLTITEHIAGGKSLAWHWTNPSGKPAMTAPDAISKETWDLVILQDHSATAAKPELTAEFKKCTQDYLDLIKKTPKTRMMFYMSMVRQADVTEASLKPVADLYTQQADALGISCAPVAVAFLKFHEREPKVALIDNQKDLKYALNKAGTHQSPFGSYLAACTIYCAIYNQSPVGNKAHATGDGTPIDDADATLAQQIAWDTWNAYKVTLKATPKAAAAGKKN